MSFPPFVFDHINQSVIRFKLRHSTTVLLAKDICIVTVKINNCVCNKDLKILFNQRFRRADYFTDEVLH